ncbi:MAG: hypothetical protein LBQ48_04730 [Oscillospiraceae bacterium]|jgi:hypothetical protein|nr:hypothetical protein [Oscillospiraceae bacterium]
MRLVDFGLYLHHVLDENNKSLIMTENGLIRYENATPEKQKNWQDKCSKFLFETRCMCSFFKRVLGHIDTSNCKKINVFCVPELRGRDILIFHDGFIEVHIKFDNHDYNSFSQLDDLGKKKMALELLMEGIKKVAADQNWDMKPFERKYAAIVEAGYVNEWVWKKTARSPDKKYTAKVLCQHEVKKIDGFIVVTDKKNDEIYRKKLITEKPNEFIFMCHLGEIRWLDNQKVSLLNTFKAEHELGKFTDENWAREHFDYREWIVDIEDAEAPVTLIESLAIYDTHGNRKP